MLTRRQFLRNSALIAAGVIAADQLEILDRLAPRRLWAGADFAARRIPLTITHAMGMQHIPDGGYEAMPWNVSEVAGRATTLHRIALRNWP